MKRPRGHASDPILLTPGPLTTSAAVKQAMGRDWGSRNADFLALTDRVRRRLTGLVGGDGSHVCVPLQGSGTFAVEAALGTLVPPRDARLLILVNGAYGRRMARICRAIGRSFVLHETAEDVPPDPSEVAARLRDDPSITHVAMVHCETTSGILNPLEALAEVVAAAGRPLLVDAMSTLGGLPIDLPSLPAAAVMASANKCLEGVPGLGFVVVDQELLATCEGNAPSLSLDLFDQAAYLERTGQWRFTPPTQVVAALDRALEELEQEGGVEARRQRYSENCRLLRRGLTGLGFELFLPERLQAPIIVTVRVPEDPRFDFQELYRALETRGVILYPGAVTREPTFRVGCIGRLDAGDMERALGAIRDALEEAGMPTAPRRSPLASSGLELPDLTGDQIEDYRRDGYLVVPGAFPPEVMEQVDAWAREVEALPEVSGRHWVFHERSRLDGGELINRIEKISPFHAGFADLTRALAGLVGQLLGEEVLLFKEKINFKMPGGAGFEPHQDSQAGWEAYADGFVSAMLCIDEATPENGCLELAPGEHRRGLLRGMEPLTEEGIAGMEFRVHPTRPGDVVLFDAYTPHRSGPNETDTARRMYFATYNRASAGDHLERYYADKHRSYPPDVDRVAGREYEYKV